MGQGPAYYGDLQENDGSLLQFESEAENEGAYIVLIVEYSLTSGLDWEEACSNLRNALSLPADSPLPVLPRQARTSPLTSSDSSHGVTKRKAGDRDDDSDMPPSEDVKRVKGDSPSEAEQTLIHVRAAASYIPFLTPEILLPPKLPTHDEMEAILLALRKKALVEEYFGGGESKDDIVVG